MVRHFQQRQHLHRPFISIIPGSSPMQPPGVSKLSCTLSDNTDRILPFCASYRAKGVIEYGKRQVKCMGKLWGSQKGYDKNHDGRLSSREWDNWYAGTYGVDIELSERKRARQTEASWTVWLDRTLETVDAAYSIVTVNTRKLLGSTASDDLVPKVFLYWITRGILDGSVWETVWSTNVGMFVGNTRFYPIQSVVKYLLKRHPELGSCEAVENAARSGNTLHEEIGALNRSDCGLFWKAMIDVLPPYREEAIQNFDIISSFTPYEKDADTEKAETLRELMKALFPIYNFFSGKTDDAADQESDRLRMTFETFWVQLGAPDEAAEDEL